MIFEMATGDFLFDPRRDKNFSKNDDHLAQMMELLGSMPKNQAFVGKHKKRYFDSSNHLRRIRGLKFWPIHKVLINKYKMNEKEARDFEDFLMPMLEWDPAKRASAQQMLDHPWLHTKRSEDSRMTDKEIEQYNKKRQQEIDNKEENLDDPFFNIEMSKLIEEDEDQNQGDVEDNNKDIIEMLEAKEKIRK